MSAAGFIDLGIRESYCPAKINTMEGDGVISGAIQSAMQTNVRVGKNAKSSQ
jgi:hypothetical protein